MQAEHSYVGEKPTPDSSGEEMEDSGHSVDSENAVNSPAPKKTQKELSLRELQVNIIDAVSAKINERADGLEKMIRENTSKIVDLETSLNHAYKSIEELKLANTATSEKCIAQEKTIADMQERLSEAERYRRRWGLRLYGVPENQDENVKRLVRDICNRVAPDFPDGYMDMAVDVAHRIGKKQDAIVSRSIIIQFAFRTARDAVWKKAKESAFLKERKLRFGEDLTAADKAAKAKLWPLVQQARNQGNGGYYRGIRAFFANGKEIRPG